MTGTNMKNQRSVLLFTFLLMRGCLSATKDRYFTNGTSVTCTGVICPKNEIFVPCTAGDGITDSCEPCPSDRPVTAGDSPNSALFSEPLIDFQCRNPEEDCSCSEESRLMNLEECQSTLEPICQCDVTRGYFGNDPKLCNTSYSYKCKRPGYQLSFENGKCLPCAQGTYKDGYGFGECIQQPICKYPQVVDFQGSASRRRTCKSLDKPLTTKKPVGYDSVSLSTKSTQQTTTKSQKDSSTTVKPKRDSNVNKGSNILRTIIIVFSIVVGLGMICGMFYCIPKCRKKQCGRKEIPNGYESVPTRNNSSSDVQDKHFGSLYEKTDSKKDLVTFENELKEVGNQKNVADKLEECLKTTGNEKTYLEHTQNGNVNDPDNIFGNQSNEVSGEKTNTTSQKTSQRKCSTDGSIPEEDIGANGTHLGNRDEPDGAENDDVPTALKEVKGSQTGEALESNEDHETFAKPFYRSDTIGKRISQEMNLQSLLKSEEPRSNDCVPSIGLRRNPHIEEPPVVPNITIPKDSGFDSKFVSAGDTELDNQPGLSIGSLNSEG